MEGFQEFLNNLQKRGSKPHHISHCLGTRDAWKWVRKNHWEALRGIHCEQSLYSKIINEVNLILSEQILEGHEIEFPHQMGKIVLSAVSSKVYIKDGEVKNTYNIDWKKTLDYWYQNPEARESHKPIKWVQNNLYYIHYYKKHAHFNNRFFYQFRPNRSLLKKMGKVVQTRKIKAEILEDYG